ncbi:MAG: PocR ligand-binding domain-containing protein [Desulfosarcina sp.]|nr:PocR ligand-binding domain-containing protein [Desulfosarcina sp.]
MDRSIHLLDLISKEKLDELLRVFTEATGVASIITEVDGRPITQPHNFTTLCLNYARSTEQGRHKCYQSDSYGGRESAELKKCLIYRCLNAGLLDSAAPVIVEGYHLANVLCGQVLEEPAETDVAIQRAHAIGITDIEGYLESIKKITIMSRERLRSIVNLMEVITQTVSEQALKKYLSYKQSQHYLRKLINSVSDCIISTDSDANISMINEAGASMFGLIEEKLMGQSIFSLFSDATATSTFQKQIAHWQKEKERIELTAVDVNRRTFPVQMSLSKITAKIAKDSGYVAVLRDISEEKKAERMKEDLIGMLTHDMGNPVLSIQKAMQLLVDETLGRLKNGQFLLRKLLISLNQILQKSIRQVIFFAQDKRISICFEPVQKPLELWADQNRLLRAVTNILDNAIKYSPEGSLIKVFVRKINGGEKEEIKTVTGQVNFQGLIANQPYFWIAISDQGLGIPKKYQKIIFDKFFSVQSRDGNGRKGVGLGLTFCKQVIEAHEGFIWVESPLNPEETHQPRGCQFNFVLPTGSLS